MGSRSAKSPRFLPTVCRPSSRVSSHVYGHENENLCLASEKFCQVMRLFSLFIILAFTRHIKVAYRLAMHACAAKCRRSQRDEYMQIQSSNITFRSRHHSIINDSLASSKHSLNINSNISFNLIMKVYCYIDLKTYRTQTKSQSVDILIKDFTPAQTSIFVFLK